MRDASRWDAGPARAAALLDEGRFDEARAASEEALSDLAAAGGDDWRSIDVSALIRRLGSPERGRALARALWVASTVDELEGRIDRARSRCHRAIELYARLRIESEELDVRAARELGAAIARLGKPRP